MAKWSVALFGHDKYKYGIFETEHNVCVARYVNAPSWNESYQRWEDGKVLFPAHVYHLYETIGNERRCVPGSIVAFKPYGQDWSELEKKHFLIVTVDGLDQFQMAALCEEEWDLGKYKPYAPLTFAEYFTIQWNKTLLYADPSRPQGFLEANKDKWYGKYLWMEEHKSAVATVHWKKRRYRVMESDLENMGVDLVDMKEKDTLYNPDLEISLNTCFDKLKDRYVLGVDNFKLIPDRTLDEMRNPKTADELLAEIKT